LSISNQINKGLLSQGIPEETRIKASSAVISSLNPTREEVNYDATVGGTTIPITHPYLGPNSWIRIMPEKGTLCMVARKAENGDPYITSYLRTGSAEPFQKATDQDKFYYKTLKEGEIDLASPGVANVFLSRRGTLELRGGSSTVKLHAERGEIEARAPTHTKAILGNKRQAVGNEERFGVVQRPGALNKNFPGQPTIRNIVETLPNYFAKEYLRNIKSEGPIRNLTLIDHREGDVYDDSGTALQASTGKKLRSITKFGTEVPNISATTEVDVDGNIVVTMPNTAVQGLHVTSDSGHVKFTVGQDFAVSAIQSILMSCLDLDIKAKSSVTVNSPSIKLGSSKATHPVIQGDILVNWLKQVALWLNTHTHASNGVVSTPPIILPPSMLSRKVVVE
jgi:hypothetical protein